MVERVVVASAAAGKDEGEGEVDEDAGRASGGKTDNGGSVGGTEIEVVGAEDDDEEASSEEGASEGPSKAPDGICAPTVV